MSKATTTAPTSWPSPRWCPPTRPRHADTRLMPGRSAGQGVGDGGDDHLERGSFVAGAVHPDRALVGFGDGLHDGQAEPEPARLAVAERLGAAEPAEDAVELGGRDAAARVAYGQDHVPALAM